MKLVAASRTDPGRARENNEDAFVVDERIALFAVADGMGGHRGGEVASATAIEALRAAVASGRPLDAAVKLANNAVIDKAAQDQNLSGMGTTMTAVVALGGSSLLIGHVGDSRAYLLRDGNIERLTEDHSLVEELVREGRLTAEQAESHPQRHIVTRALGVDDDIDVDLYSLDAHTGDRLIVCSDGLTTMLREREVERIARTEPDPQRAAENLVDAANEAGGEDNITVVVLDVVEVDDAAPPDPEALAATSGDGSDATMMQPAEPPGAPEEPEAPRAAPVQSRRRRITSIAFIVIPVLFIVAVAFGAIAWYDRNNWFLSADAGAVVLYRGRPDPVLWHATRVDIPTVRVTALNARGRADVAGKRSFSSKQDATSYLDTVTTTSTTTTTTTTTKPKRTTTTTRKATRPQTGAATTTAKGP